MVSLKSPLRKLLEVGIIAFSVFCAARLVYGYLVLGRGRLPIVIAALSAFAAIVISSVISLTARHPAQVARSPTKKQAFGVAAGGLLFALTGLLLFLFPKQRTSAAKRLLLLSGSLFFAAATVVYIRRVRRQSAAGEETLGHGPGAHEGGQEG